MQPSPGRTPSFASVVDGIAAELIASQFLQTPGGIWVPASVAGAPNSAAQHPMMQFFRVTVGWKNVAGVNGTIAEIADRVQRYPLWQAVAMLARISLVVEKTRASVEQGRSRQSEWILARTLTPEVARAVLDRISGDPELRPAVVDGRAVLFHERQLLNVLKVALLVCDDRGLGSGERVDWTALIEALLMMNDLIDQQANSADAATDSGRQQLELYFTAVALFNAGSHTLHDFVRAYSLYVEPSSIGSLRGAADIPASLERATGLPAATVWRALYAIYAAWSTLQLTHADSGTIFSSRTRYLSTLGKLSEESREKWFSLAAWELPALQRRVRSDFALDNLRYFDVLPLEERPLIANGDQVVCTSVPLIRRLAGSSIQYRLLDPTVFTPDERLRFLDTRGRVVERYTASICARAFGERFVDESSLRVYAGGKKVCDGVIVYPDAAILVEFKTTSVLIGTRHATDYAAHRELWRRAITKAADQFVSVVSLIRDGKLTPVGIPPSSARSIFVVVGMFEQAITVHGYAAIFESDLKDHELAEMIRSHTVRALQLFDVHDFEMIEVAAENGSSALDILSAKTQAPETTFMSLTHYLNHVSAPYRRQHSVWHASRFAEISGAARDFYRSLGLTSNSDDATST